MLFQYVSIVRKYMKKNKVVIIPKVRIMLKLEDSLFQVGAHKELQGPNNIVFLHIDDTDLGILL